MPQRAVEKQYYEMPELVGFQTMVIRDPNGMTFDAVGVFSLAFQLYLNLAHHTVLQYGHADDAIHTYIHT